MPAWPDAPAPSPTPSGTLPQTDGSTAERPWPKHKPCSANVSIATTGVYTKARPDTLAEVTRAGRYETTVHTW
jgi:hypothetical protein